jgi:hypothetical protein
VDNRTWRPVRSKADAAVYYDREGFSTLQQVSFAGSLDYGTLSAELVATSENNLGVRLAFGALVSQVDTSETKTTTRLERFFTGGGNAYINAAYPLADFGTSTSDGRLIVFLLPRIAGELPVAGTEVENPTGNADLAFETHAYWPNPTSPISFFFQVRAGHVFGFGDFAQHIGVDRENFWLGHGTGGVRILGTTVGIQLPLFGPDALERIPARLTVQVLPAF